MFVSKLSARRCAQNQLPIQERLCPTNDAVGVSFFFIYLFETNKGSLEKLMNARSLLLLFFFITDVRGVALKPVLKFMPYD